MQCRVKFAVNPCGEKNKFVKKGRGDLREKKHSLKNFGSWVGLKRFLECVFCGLDIYFSMLLIVFDL